MYRKILAILCIGTSMCPNKLIMPDPGRLTLQSVLTGLSTEDKAAATELSQRVTDIEIAREDIKRPFAEFTKVPQTLQKISFNYNGTPVVLSCTILDNSFNRSSETISHEDKFAQILNASKQDKFTLAPTNWFPAYSIKSDFSVVDTLSQGKVVYLTRLLEILSTMRAIYNSRGESSPDPKFSYDFFTRKVTNCLPARFWIVFNSHGVHWQIEMGQLTARQTEDTYSPELKAKLADLSNKVLEVLNGDSPSKKEEMDKLFKEGHDSIPEPIPLTEELFKACIEYQRIQRIIIETPSRARITVQAPGFPGQDMSALFNYLLLSGFADRHLPEINKCLEVKRPSKDLDLQMKISFF